MAPPETRTAALAGIRAVAPILPGVVPFALIAGFAGIEAGVTELQAIVMSVVVFAGAAQIAALDLIGRDGAVAVIVLTALVINARFVMYSASLAPHLAAAPLRMRALAAYLLTDQAYAVSIVRYRTHPGDVGTRLAFYLGAGATLWVIWLAGTVAGALGGAAVPEAWSLDFAIPLVFIALLVPALRSRSDHVAAAIAAVGAVAAGGLRFNSGLLLAALAGIAAGYLVASR